MISRFYEKGLTPAQKTGTALSEMERRLRAYAVSNKEFNLDHIFIASPADVYATASAGLQARFSCESARLTTDGNGSGVDDNYPASLNAAAGLI
jgi:hypothetical protein